MKGLGYVYWQDGQFWLGYLEEYPDYMTQGDSFQLRQGKQLTVVSLVFGFLLVPLHELGHVIGDWLTGHPAAMSYARDYLLSGGETPFLGLLGGPLLPICVSVVAVILIYLGKNASWLYPVAIQGAVERLVLYGFGILPSDERDLARLAGWSSHSFQQIFLALETVLLVLIIISLFKFRMGVKRSAGLWVIIMVCLVLSAATGICVVERFFFPEQFKIQFG